jgi:hypothetical protein
MARAYKSVQCESLREMYLERERLISVTAPPVDMEEVEWKVDERNRKLQILVNKLTAENLELRSRLANVELSVTELKKALEKLVNT